MLTQGESASTFGVRVSCFLVAILALAGCGDGSTPDNLNTNCTDGEHYVNGKCRKPCNTDADCLSDTPDCRDGVCQETLDGTCDGVASGNERSRLRYASVDVGCTEACQSETQTQTCQAGHWSEWSGSFAYDSCTVLPCAGCGQVADGTSETRRCYDASLVPPDSLCTFTEQTRTCRSGAFNPNWPACQFLDCVVQDHLSCGTTPHGNSESRKCYVAATVLYGSTCSSTTQTRTCNNGDWSPDYSACSYLSCTVNPPPTCTQGAVVASGCMCGGAIKTTGYCCSDVWQTGACATTGSPYHGAASSIPGTIQAEDFDLGGSGVAFAHTPWPSEPAPVNYRSDSAAVCVAACTSGTTSCGYRVGYVNAGDWLGYTVSVQTTDTYTFAARVTNPAATTQTIHVEVDGSNITGSITLPHTSAWTSWTDATATLSLSAGTHFIKIVAETGENDFDYFTFGNGTVPVTVSVSPTMATVQTNGTQQFSATVTGSANTAVTWSVLGTGCGSVNSSGFYTAPASVPAGSCSVKATSLADASKNATAAITVDAIPTGINVKDAPYNATGNGSTDDTGAIQAAVNAVSSGGTVVVPAGIFMINVSRDNDAGIILKSNMTLYLAAGATLRAITSSANQGDIIRVRGVSNVTITGPGTVQGEKATHTGPQHEGFMGISINTSSHITVSGITSRDNFSDGIYVSDGCSDITISGVTCDNNTRQGMSITSVVGMLVENSTFSNTDGTAPGCGIDIEPNAGETVSDVRITGCTFANNAGGGFQQGASDANYTFTFSTGTIFENNELYGNGGSYYNDGGIAISDCDTNTIRNNNIHDNYDGGLEIYQHATNVTVTGNTITNNSGWGIRASVCDGSVITGNTITGNSGVGFYHDSSSGTYSPNTVSGNGG